MFYFLPQEGKHTQGVTQAAPHSEDLKMVKIFCILCLSIVRDRVACTQCIQLSVSIGRFSPTSLPYMYLLMNLYLAPDKIPLTPPRTSRHSLITIGD